MTVRNSRFIYVLAALCFIVTAIFSEGYYHADEHFQVIEYAQSKIEQEDYQRLAWEYEAQIRPSLQPYLALVVIQVVNFIGDENSHLVMLILRLLSGFFLFISIRFFIKKTIGSVKPNFQFWYVLLSYFLWFVPFLAVRFSSETWSAGCLLIGLALLIDVNRDSKNYLLSGVVLAIGFWFRFQLGICIAGILLWLLIIRKEQLKNLCLLGGSALLTMAIAVLMDSLFYGNLVLTPWNYLSQNLLQDSSTEFGFLPFGSKPIYYYFYVVFRFSVAPIGLVLLLSFLYYTIRMPKSIVCWAALLFFLVHCLIGHKEFRFLFPLAFLTPLMIIHMWEAIWTEDRRKIINVFSGLLLVINSIALVIVCLTPAGHGEAYVINQIEKEQNSADAIIYFTPGHNPYDPCGGLVASFYVRYMYSVKELSIEEWISLETDSSENRSFLVTTRQELSKLSDPTEVRVIAESIPAWLKPAYDLYKNSEKSQLILVERERVD